MSHAFAAVPYRLTNHYQFQVPAVADNKNWR